jgi:hypothetical protein
MECLMPSLAPDQLVQNLHDCNCRLGAWLDTLSPSCDPFPVQVCATSPQLMAGLLSELMQAGEWLRALPPEPNPELQQELGDYRKNVERLRDLMPAIQSALLAERARIERERARVEAAAEWSRRTRQTL